MMNKLVSYFLLFIFILLSGCTEVVKVKDTSRLKVKTYTFYYAGLTSLVKNNVANLLPTTSDSGFGNFTTLDLLPTGMTLNSSTGAISGTPTQSLVATTFSITATAPNGSLVSTLVILTVNDNNQAPTISTVTNVAINEDTPSAPLAFTISDAHDVLTCAAAVTGTSNNVALIANAQILIGGAYPNCTVTLTPELNQSGTATITLVVDDGNSTDTSNFDAVLAAVDDAPAGNVLAPGAFNEDTELILTLTYSDVENDLATLCSVSSLTNFTESTPCSCNLGTCSVGLTGNLNYNGTSVITYNVTANGLTSNSSNATLVVTAVDDDPVTSSFTTSTINEDLPLIFALSYSDVDSDQATSCNMSNITDVTVTTPCACLAGVCTVGVTGTANFFGNARVDFEVVANGRTSNTSRATIPINAVDDAPTTSAFTSADFNEDTIQSIILPYSDVESNLATTCTISNLASVSVTTACTCNLGACTVSIRGTLNYFGAASFSYTVTSNLLTSNASQVSFNILPVDDAPATTLLLSPATPEDLASIVIIIPYTDPENDPATACTLSNLTNVFESLPCSCNLGACTVRMQGTSNFFGAASYKFTVTANGRVSNISNSTMTITPVDDIPVGTSTLATIIEDTPTIVQLSFTDVDSPVISCNVYAVTNLSIVTPCSCTLGICSFGVTSTPNYNGVASYDFTVTSLGQASLLVTNAVNVSGADDAPMANNFSPTDTNKNTERIITLSYADVDGDLGTSCTVTGVANATITTPCSCNGGGVCTVGLTGTLNFVGLAGFSFKVTANAVLSNSQNIGYNIVDSGAPPQETENKVPIAENITAPTFYEDTESLVTLSYTNAELKRDTTCNVSSLNGINISTACTCTLGICSVGVTGPLNYHGSASFNYTVKVNGMTSNTATASLTINSADDAPLANILTPAAFDQDTESYITLSYTDVEGDFASACNVTNLNHVTVTNSCFCLLGTCSVGVTGTQNYAGSASFDYSVTTNGLVSNSAPVSLTINLVPKAPSGLSYSETTLLIRNSYSLSPTISSGTPATSFTIMAGSLPPGLILNSSSGEISGSTLVGNHQQKFNLEIKMCNTIGCNTEPLQFVTQFQSMALDHVEESFGAFIGHEPLHSKLVVVTKNAITEYGLANFDDPKIFASGGHQMAQSTSFIGAYAVDLNQDSLLEIVVMEKNTNKILIYGYRNGELTLIDSIEPSQALQIGHRLDFGDVVNADGKVDIIHSFKQSSLYQASFYENKLQAPSQDTNFLFKATSHFTMGQNTVADNSFTALAVLDFNGDATQDIAVFDEQSKSVGIFSGPFNSFTNLSTNNLKTLSEAFILPSNEFTFDFAHSPVDNNDSEELMVHGMRSIECLGSVNYSFNDTRILIPELNDLNAISVMNSSLIVKSSRATGENRTTILSFSNSFSLSVAHSVEVSQEINQNATWIAPPFYFPELQINEANYRGYLELGPENVGVLRLE